MIEISKELANAVLGKEISEINIIGSTINYIVPNYETEEGGELVYIDLGTNINLYEFTHKCKEWALDNGYYLRVERGINYYDTLQWVTYLNRDMNDGADYIEYWNNTEPEAIIKACEWVLKQTKGENNVENI